MDTDILTLGEYERRLRRGLGWNLQQLAEQTGISYTHLSRIENDSTVPNPETVAKLATALGGDLKRMLALAGCLPRVILDRIRDLEESDDGSGVLNRAFVPAADQAQRELADVTITELCDRAGIPRLEVANLAAAVEEFTLLPLAQRLAICRLISTLYGEAYGAQR